MVTRIASIHFSPLHLDRSIYGAIYDVPAVPKDAEPFILTVKDEVQRWRGPYGEGYKLESKTIYGELIARDILEHWAKLGLGMTLTCHPGIWIVRDRIHVVDEEGKPKYDFDDQGKLTRPVWRDATPQEYKAMWAEDEAHAKQADAAYAEYLMLKATADTRDHPEKIPFVDKNAVLAARQYGKDFQWMHPLVTPQEAKCPACRKAVDPEAYKCPHCQEIINLQRYAEREAEKQRAVEAATKKVTPQFPKQAHA